MNWDIEGQIIFETVTGSQMYGTATPNSDTDYRGVCIPPVKVLLDPFHGFEQKDQGFEEEDRVIYSLGKFVKLCADANPNIIELLFAPTHCIKTQSYEWIYLKTYLSSFISKKVKYTFTGYAISQLHKLQRHRKWFVDPPKKKPTREDYKLPDVPLISGEGLMALSKVGFTYLKDETVDYVKRELDYRAEKEAWDNYITWKNERNPDRQVLEEKYGYDTKCAMHLVRLMYEGQELLLSGEITFPLIYAQELKGIRNGLYTYDYILYYAEKLEKDFEEWYAKSILPDKPNWVELEKMYFELLEFSPKLGGI